MTMIFDRVRVQNFRCLRDVQLSLSPMHALIGPNDSGKSTILQAVQTALQFASSTFRRDPSGVMQPFEPTREDGMVITLEQSTTGARYVLSVIQGTVNEHLLIGDREVLRVPRPGWNDRGLIYTHHASIQPPDVSVLHPFMEGLSKGSRLVRLDPDGLREPSDLLTTGMPIDFVGERGQGLAGTIDAVRDRDDGSYEKFRATVLEQFPHVEALGFHKAEKNRKTIRIKLKNGPEVGAEHVSEGLLYFMGFVALQYLRPVAINLVEEPENGLYPPLIKPVVDALRQSTTAEGSD